MNHINHLYISAVFLSKTRCKTKPTTTRPREREVRIHEMSASLWEQPLGFTKILSGCKTFQEITDYKKLFSISKEPLEWLTRNINWCSCIDNSTVGPYTVSTWCCGLNFEAHIFVRGVAELQVCSDHICERTWGGEQKQTWNHTESTFQTEAKQALNLCSQIL